MSIIAFWALKCKKSARFNRCVIIAAAVTITAVKLLFSEFTVTDKLIKMALFILILAIPMSLFYNSQIVVKSLLCTLPVALNFFSSLLSVQIIALITGRVDSITNAPDNIYNYISLILSVVVFSYFFLLFAHMQKNKKIRLKNSEFILLLFIIIASTLFFLFLDFVSINEDISTHSRIWLILTVLLVVIINAISFVFIRGISISSDINAENELLKLQQQAKQSEAELLAEKYDEFHKLKHDFKNQISTVAGLISTGNINEATEYIEKYFNVVNKSEQSIVHTENTALDAIMNSEIGKANAKGVKIEVTAIVGKEIFVEDIDFCSLIGNLLDNAIEAAATAHEPLVSFKLKNTGEQIIIVIKNPLKNSVIKSNPELNTSKKSKSEHGYGMKIIKKIINKYNGILDIYEQNNSFCQLIVLNKI